MNVNSYWQSGGHCHNSDTRQRYPLHPSSFLTVPIVASTTAAMTKNTIAITAATTLTSAETATTMPSDTTDTPV